MIFISRMARIVLATTIICLFQLVSYGQDARNTQNFAVPLQLNPAIMGANTDLKLSLNYRNQWGSIEDGFNTANATFLYPVILGGGNKLDFGLSFLNDQAGAFTTMNVALAVGYNTMLSSSGHNLSGALLVGFAQKSLDVASLTFDEQFVIGSFDAANPTNENVLNESVSYPDVGAGLMWFYNPPREGGGVNAYAGIAAYHVNKPKETLTDQEASLPIKFSYQVGIKIIGKGKVDFTPNFKIITQSGVEEIATGIYLDYYLKENIKLVVGTWYKRKDAIAILLGFDINKFMFAYSFDLSASELGNVISGANTHEFTLGFKINWDKKETKLNPSPFSNF